MKMRGLMLLLLAIAGLTVLPPLAMAQSLADSGDSSSAAVLPSAGTTHPQLALTYTRPTEKTKLHNYFFDTFGPYPAPRLRLALTKRKALRQSGNKARRATASDLDPTSPSQD